MRVLALLLVSFLCLPKLLFASCDVIDDFGRRIHLNAPATRIISLAPDLTELLFSLRAGDQVVGVVAGSDYPNNARHLPVVANAQTLSLERVIRLKPQLLVVWGRGFWRQEPLLNTLGVRIYRHDPHHLSDIPRTLTSLGCLTGHQKEAEHLSSQFSADLDRLKQQYAKRRPVSVFFEISAVPLMTINHASWINDAITLCGGRNIFEDAPLPTVPVSLESVLMKNPQVIVMDSNQYPFKKHWQSWPKLDAVKHHAIYSINADVIERASLRLANGTLEMCKRIDEARQHYR